MWEFKEGLPLRDVFAIEILKMLMMRFREDGFCDKAAVDKAYELADYMVDARDKSPASDAESPATPSNTQSTPLFCEKCGKPNTYSYPLCDTCAIGYLGFK